MLHLWGERRGVYSVLVGKPYGKSHLEDLGVDGRVILKMHLQVIGTRGELL